MATQEARTRTISITSGKGGVGKTTLVANMATILGQQGKKVLLLDGDLGMANLDIFFGQRAAHNIQNVLKGEVELEEILIPVTHNVTLIPGGSGIFELQNLSVYQKQSILDQVGQLKSAYDFLFIDTAPGIHDEVLYLNSAAQTILVVVTPDPASIADSYALIKVLNQRYRENKFHVVMNQVKDEAEALKIFDRINNIAQKFLFVSLDYAGCVPMDPILKQSIRQQQILTVSQNETPAASSIRKVLRNLKSCESLPECKGSMQVFWQQLLGVA